MSGEHTQKPVRGFQPLNREELSRFCSEKSISHLERSMLTLSRGVPPTPSFKLYGKSDLSVVQHFLELVSHDKNVSLPTWMLEYEKSRFKKFGPQGGFAPWDDLKEDFMLYYERPTDCNIDEIVFYDLLATYSNMHLRMLSLPETVRRLKDADKIQDRAAGWSTFDLKKTDPLAQRIALNLARSGEWKLGFAYLFSRYNKLKKRLFFPMPFSSMIVQAQYYLPFLEYIQQDLLLRKSKSRFTFWADKIGLNNGKMLEIWQELVNNNLRPLPDDGCIVYVQRDFEKMDTTVATSQLANVFIPVISHAYAVRPMGEVYADLESKMLFTSTCPIITPDGIIDEDHGAASGAEITNGCETVLNDYFDRKMMVLLRDKYKYYCRRILSAGNGDDGASIFVIQRQHFDEFREALQQAAEEAAKFCGFRVNDKWHVSVDYGLYCQYMIWIDEFDRIHQAYPATLILNSIMNPEHQYNKADWDKDYRDLDIIMKLDNGRGLPYFEQLIDYVDKGMKYGLLGRSETETNRILSKYDKWRQLQDSSEIFNKELPTDITTSPTVKYLLTRRSIKYKPN